MMQAKQYSQGSVIFQVKIITLNEIIPNTYIAWILLFSVGFLSFLGQIALTTACKIESAGLVSLVRKAFDIVISFS